MSSITPQESGSTQFLNTVLEKPQTMKNKVDDLFLRRKQDGLHFESKSQATHGLFNKIIVWWHRTEYNFEQNALQFKKDFKSYLNKHTTSHDNVTTFVKTYNQKVKEIIQKKFKPGFLARLFEGAEAKQARDARCQAKIKELQLTMEEEAVQPQIVSAPSITTVIPESKTKDLHATAAKLAKAVQDLAETAEDPKIALLRACKEQNAKEVATILARLKGQPKAMKELLLARDENGFTPLHLAAFDSSCKLLDAILAAIKPENSSPHMRLALNLFSEKSQHGSRYLSPLCVACTKKIPFLPDKTPNAAYVLKVVDFMQKLDVRTADRDISVLMKNALSFLPEELRKKEPWQKLLNHYC